MLKRFIAVFLLAPWLAGAATTNIVGTWVAKRATPMGETETVIDLKVEGDKITGNITLPFGDLTIVDGKLTGDDLELTSSMDFYGQERRMVIKGKLVGEELRLTMPGGMGGPPGGPGGQGRAGGPNAPEGAGPGGPERPGGFDSPPPGGPGGPDGLGPDSPPPDVRPGGAGTNAPAMGGGRRGGPGGFSREIVARRGTPTLPRRKPFDLKSLPKITLPEIKDLTPDGLAATPPMGWNSWNKFRTRFSDTTVREIADSMVSSGMKDAGYIYINIDDGWQGERDTNGVLQANTNFPNMKELADYVHAKGLKLGIYSSPGPRTCAGYEGSYAHEELDARTWAEWGIDYLKYDWCTASRVFTNANDVRPIYQKMGEALRATGRPIVYSLCQYGRNNVWEWGPKAGGHLWRTTGDISDRWQSMANIGFRQNDLAEYAGVGRWNDPDMLEIGNGGMSDIEYRTHFSLWAILAAPLLAGNDLRTMTDATKEILLNREVIAVNQDPLGKQGHRITQDGTTEIWARSLANGDAAVGFFNRGNAEVEFSLKWSELKLDKPSRVRDLWAHADRETGSEQIQTKVPAHGVVLWRVGK